MPPMLTRAIMRTVCPSSVSPSSGAGDVVQEAWLAALRSGQGAGVSTGWLMGAMRRIALDRHRDEQRRLRHDHPGERDAHRRHAARCGSRLVGGANGRQYRHIDDYRRWW